MGGPEVWESVDGIVGVNHGGDEADHKLENVPTFEALVILLKRPRRSSIVQLTHRLIFLVWKVFLSISFMQIFIAFFLIAQF